MKKIKSEVIVKKTDSEKKIKYAEFKGLIFPAWAIMSFLIAVLIVGFLIPRILRLSLPEALLLVIDSWLRTTVGMAFLYAILFIVMAIVLFLPFRGRFKEAKSSETLGLKAKPKWSMFGRAILAYLAYFFVLIGVVAVLSSLKISGLDLDQKQDIGFKNLTTILELVVAFVSIVLLPAIVEELIFRGFVFGNMRKINGFWFSAIVTSLSFAVVHGQINVAIDTFILSMFMCHVREKTQSIYPTIFMHIVKNSIAYTFLFLLPFFGVNLIK